MAERDAAGKGRDFAAFVVQIHREGNSICCRSSWFMSPCYNSFLVKTENDHEVESKLE